MTKISVEWKNLNERVAPLLVHYKSLHKVVEVSVDDTHGWYISEVEVL